MKTEKDLKPLIDGDVLRYRCGFAADSQIRKDLLQKNPGISDEELERLVSEMDYKAVALQNVKTVLTYVTERFNPEYRLYVHDGGNFRDQLATIKKYKGNREDARRPKYYADIKTYMVDQWDAILVRNQESDDAIGIEQFDNPDKYTVIVSIDKDMLGIPGWHYNWVRDELKYQTLNNANLFFFRQMLEGDRTDNIPGINNIGPKRADAILAACEYNVDRVREAVKEQYQKQYGENWHNAYWEVGQLLYIRRKPGEECPLL